MSSFPSTIFDWTDIVLVTAMGVLVLTVIGGKIWRLLVFRHSPGRARLFAITLTAILTMPLAFDDVLTIQIVLFSAVALLAIFLPPAGDGPDA